MVFYRFSLFAQLNKRFFKEGNVCGTLKFISPVCSDVEADYISLMKSAIPLLILVTPWQLNRSKDEKKKPMKILTR